MKNLPLGKGGKRLKASYEGGEYREEKELEQIHLVLGFEGLNYHDDDIYALQIYATIMGAGGSSRLFQEIREKRGLAYNIYSFASNFSDSGLLGFYAGTSSNQYR